MSILANIVGFSRPKTMATKISYKVMNTETPPPYLGIIPKKTDFFSASLSQGL